MIGCLRTRVRKQPITALYFEFENELKFYKPEARSKSKLFDNPMVFLKEFFEKVAFEKNQHTTKKHAKLSGVPRVNNENSPLTCATLINTE